MSHGIDTGTYSARLDPSMPRILQPLAAAMLVVNQVMVWIGMAALIVASLVLSYSVFSRYLLQASTDWQDEAAVFCLVGATFLCGGFVQSLRGHVGIEAVAGLALLAIAVFFWYLTGPAGHAPNDRIVVTALTALALGADRKSTRLNSSHSQQSRMPSSA
mgnify:CR=1 FL=1